MRIPNFKNTHEAVVFGRNNYDKPEVIKELRRLRVLAEAQIDQFTSQGRFDDALYLASGQSQFLREAYEAAERGIPLVMPNKRFPAYAVAGTLLLATLLVVAASCETAHAQDIDLAAIAQIESSGNPLAHNKKDDSRGLYQITPICLKEYNNFHSKKYSMDDLWTVKVNEEIANWYLNIRIPQMLKHYKKADTIENRIIAYNAGIGYVVSGKALPKITKDYIVKYAKAVGR